MDEIIQRAKAAHERTVQAQAKATEIDEFDLDAAIEEASHHDQQVAERMAGQLLDQLMEGTRETPKEAFYDPVDLFDAEQDATKAESFEQAATQIQTRDRSLDRSLDVLASITNQKMDELAEIIKRAKRRS